MGVGMLSVVTVRHLGCDGARTFPANTLDTPLLTSLPNYPGPLHWCGAESAQTPCAGRPCKEPGDLQCQALVEARDSRGGGGAAHRQPLLAWEAGEQWPVQTLLFANKQPKLEGELVCVCSGWC